METKRRRLLKYLLFSFLAFFFCDSSLQASPTSPIVIERIQTQNPEELAFSVSIANQGGQPLEIETDYREIVNYRLGRYDFRDETESVLVKGSHIILSGEKKVIRYFRHNLKRHPSPDPSKAVVEIEVAGLGKILHEFELQKHHPCRGGSRTAPTIGRRHEFIPYLIPRPHGQ